MRGELCSSYHLVDLAELSRTVLPTPRSPTSTRLFSAFLFFTRPKSTRICSKVLSRPVSSGGGVPAPGANELHIGSTAPSFIWNYTLIELKANKIV